MVAGSILRLIGEFVPSSDRFFFAIFQSAWSRKSMFGCHIVYFPSAKAAAFKECSDDIDDCFALLKSRQQPLALGW